MQKKFLSITSNKFKWIPAQTILSQYLDYTWRIRSRCRPLATASKVSAAEVMDRKHDFFPYQTLAHFSLLRYCINKDFFKGYTAMRPPATFPLPNSVRGAPVWSTVNVQWTFKKVLIEKFGALWPLVEKFQGNPQLLQPFRRAPDLCKPAQMERQNSTPFSRKSEKIEFFSTIFFELQEFPICEILIRPPCQWVLSMLKV